MSGESATANQAGAAAPPRIRHDWLDALKGLGILAVVAGHVWTRGPLRDAIYSFHMPLFFMATGVTVRAASPTLLARRLAVGLGLPFLSFGLLLLCADFLIEGLRGVRPIFPDFWSGVRGILFSTESLRGPFGILWFVPCLIVARLIWNGLLLGLGPVHKGLTLLVMSAIALAAVAADALGGQSPLGLLAVPAALLMIWAGALWKEWQPGLAVAAAVALLALAALLWFPPLNLRAGEIGWPLIGLIGAAAIVDRLAWGLRLLPVQLVHSLAWFGRNSLVIMFGHLAFVHYLAPYAPRLALFAAGIAGSLLIGWLARRTRVSRLMLLGEK